MISSRQFGKLAAETIDVLCCREQPYAVRPWFFHAISQGTQQHLVKIDVGEAKHSLDRRADRSQFFEDKRKGILFVCSSNFHFPLWVDLRSSASLRFICCGGSLTASRRDRRGTQRMLVTA